MVGAIRRDDAAWAAALADPAACRAEVVVAQLISRPGRGRGGYVVRDEHVCNLVVDGGGTLHQPGRGCRLRPGDLFWIAPGVRYLFAADPGGRIAWLNCRFRLRHAGGEPCFAADHIVVPDAMASRRWFELWISDRRSRHPDAMRRFVLGLALLWGDMARPAPAGGGLGEARRRRIVEQLRQADRRWPTPAALARLVGLGPTHFRRAFRATFGLSPRAIILRERLARAADRLRLEPDRRIADLASELGWDDPALFSRQFRAAYGQPPDRWRRT